MKWIGAYAALMMAFACQNPSKPPGNTEATGKKSLQQPARINILHLFEEAESIDSLVILYFTDKINFRYYTFYTTDSLVHLSIFKENLYSDTIPSNQCIKDGTIFGYKNGSIYTTLYFNLSDSCRFLRLFKNGKLYNYPLNLPFSNQLNSFKKFAKNP